LCVDCSMVVVDLLSLRDLSGATNTCENPVVNSTSFMALLRVGICAWTAQRRVFAIRHLVRGMSGDSSDCALRMCAVTAAEVGSVGQEGYGIREKLAAVGELSDAAQPRQWRRNSACTHTNCELFLPQYFAPQCRFPLTCCPWAKVLPASDCRCKVRPRALR